MSLIRLRDWMLTKALPLWGSAGFDPCEEQFVEQIGLGGEPLLDVQRRSMVQARQMYVFGKAYEHGWHHRGRDLAEAAYVQLVRRYGLDGGRQGWAFLTDRQGNVVDAKRDLYAQAFVLLGLATIASLGIGGDEPLRLARETVDFLDARMRCQAVAMRSRCRMVTARVDRTLTCICWKPFWPCMKSRRRRDMIAVPGKSSISWNGNSWFVPVSWWRSSSSSTTRSSRSAHPNTASNRVTISNGSGCSRNASG